MNCVQKVLKLKTVCQGKKNYVNFLQNCSFGIQHTYSKKFLIGQSIS